MRIDEISKLKTFGNYRTTLQYKSKTMNLRVINFKCLKDATFDISTDYCLISGQSGSGKTSIFMAIQFAITGEGKKIVTYGAKLCKVILTINDIIITRTKGPCRLLVKCQDITYEDKEAQAVIDVNFKYFMMGYVSQRVYKSFLATSPAEKLSILENIAFDNINVQNIQYKCKELISNRKGLALKYTTEINTISSLLQDLGFDQDTSIDTIVDIDAEIEETATQTNNYNKLVELRKECKYLDDEMDKLGIVKVVDRSYVDALLCRKSKYDRYISTKVELEKMSLKEDVDDIVIEEFQEIIQLQDQIAIKNRLQKEYDKLVEFRKTHGVLSKCPACSTTICIRGNTVSLDDHVKEISHQKIQECNDKISVVEMQLESCKVKVQRLESLRNNYDEVDYGKELKLLMENRLYNQKYNLKLDKVRNMECLPPDENVDVLLQNIELNAKLNQCRERRKTVNEKIVNLSVLCDETVNYKEKLEHLRLMKNKHQYQLQYNKIQALKEKEKQLDIQLPSSVKLLSLIKTAERMALESVISLINERTNLYLGLFCETITANISLETDKVNIVINIDDNETDVSSVSGGEYARIVLAFAVAMAEITNAPMLMLDEILSSLDSDTSNLVLDALKSNYDGCILIIAHQITIGGFSQVIKL